MTELKLRLKLIVISLSIHMMTSQGRICVQCVTNGLLTKRCLNQHKLMHTGSCCTQCGKCTSVHFTLDIIPCWYHSMLYVIQVKVLFRQRLHLLMQRYQMLIVIVLMVITCLNEVLDGDRNLWKPQHVTLDTGGEWRPRCLEMYLDADVSPATYIHQGTLADDAEQRPSDDGNWPYTPTRGFNIIGVYAGHRIHIVTGMVDRLMNVANLVQPCICSPLVTPYTSSGRMWRWMTGTRVFTSWRGTSFMNNRPVPSSTPPKTHCGGTERPRSFRGLARVTTLSSMASVRPGPSITMGCASRSAEHTSAGCICVRCVTDVLQRSDVWMITNSYKREVMLLHSVFTAMNRGVHFVCYSDESCFEAKTALRAGDDERNYESSGKRS